MRPDLYEIDGEALTAVEAGKRLGIVARAGKAMPNFGTAAEGISSTDRDLAVSYLLEVFRTEVEDWSRAEGYAWGDWIVVPREHRDLCVFGVVDPDEPERSREYVIEYAIERCVTTGDWSVDGLAMARVDARAVDALEREAVA